MASSTSPMSRSPSPAPERDALAKRKRSPSEHDASPPPASRARMSVSPPPAPAPALAPAPSPSLAPAPAPAPGTDRIALANIPRVLDDDPVRRREREAQMKLRLAEQEAAGVVPKPKVDFRAEMQKMAATRGGGAYLPPAKLRAMQAELNLNDPSAPEYQRIRWDALRKSINGLINKVNVGNIKFIIPELFGENLIRGRGLLCRSVMKAQASSLPYTPVFAALIAVLNTKLPVIGELLINRLISQFRRAFKRNDKPTCIATSTFLAHLVNQQVVGQTVALEIIILLLEKVTNDSVEIAVGFVKEVGAFLAESSPKINEGVFERFRAILTESQVEKRSQYMIEVLIQVRRDKYKDNPIIPEGLDLVEDTDVITHEIGLSDEITVQEGLNIFKADPDFQENEDKYEAIKNEILGVDSDSDSGSGSGSSSGSESDDEEEAETGIVDGKVEIHDHTGANLINFRRTIYLTIMSSLDFEEAAHKLLKTNIDEGMELELANMIVECCSQERSYTKFYGLLGERFCKVNQSWAITFEQCFRNYYDTIHRYETNRLRNISRFFGHLLAQDGIPWTVFEVVKMNEDDTTSSSRIFVKILFQELSESLGLKMLAERFKEPTMQGWFAGMFPVDNPKNTRFSINYFTSIGLGALTENMREHLKNAPALIAAQRRQLEAAQNSDSSSDVSSTSSESETESSSEYSSSDSEDSRRAPRRYRSSSYDSRARGRHSRSRSPSYSDDSRSPSRSPPRRRKYSPSPVRNGNSGRARRGSSYDSRSPPRRRRSPSRDMREDSRSPPRRRYDSPPRRRRGDSYDSRSPPRRSNGGGRSANGRPKFDSESPRDRRRSMRGDSPPRREERPRSPEPAPEPRRMLMNPARAAMLARR